MDSKDLKDLREERKEWFSQMEQKLKETQPKEEDSLFYYHSSEDRIVLSHAMFWTMTQLQFFKSKLRKEKCLAFGDRIVKLNDNLLKEVANKTPTYKMVSGKHLDEKRYESIHDDCEELVRILVSRCKKLDTDSSNSEVRGKRAEGGSLMAEGKGGKKLEITKPLW